MTNHLSNLTKTTTRPNKIIGRGRGSGKGGHASTRGTKGQKSRTSLDVFFEGTKFKKSLIKKLPLYRGKNKFKSRQDDYYIVNLKYLNIFKEGEEVNLTVLKEKQILDKRIVDGSLVKILGEGEIRVALKVNLPCSKQAAEKIKKAGGEVIFGAKKAVDKNKEK